MPRELASLPAPPGWPLVGHALSIDVPRMHAVLEAWDKEYGPVFTYRIGRATTLCISDPPLIDQVYRQRPHAFRRLRTIADVIEELGIVGVFTAEGDAWPPQRKVALRALHPKHLDGFFPALRATALALRARWLRTAGQPVDLRHDFMSFTVDVTTQLAFARAIDTLADQRAPLLEAIDPIFPALSRRIVALLPTWRWVRSPADRQLEASIAEVRAFLDEVIRATRAEARTGPARHFLDAMLDQTDAAPDDDDTLFGNAVTMLLAGEDTTANTLAWACHLLMDHPEVWERLRAASAVGADGVAAARDATRSPYVDQVIHEVMRLKSVGPMLFFEAVTDVVVGDVAVPAGTPITVLTRQPGLDPERFPDPSRFDPERWSDPALPAQLQKTGVFTPFGSGPRLCPGRELALLEMRLVLPMLAHGFTVSRHGASDDVHEVNGFTMSPNAVMATLRPR